MANQLLSFSLWYFLPNFLSGKIQTALYTIFIRAGDTKPAPGSARYARDRNNIRTAVILAYLLYTIYEADYNLRIAGDFYQLLGVPHDVTERALQSRFRRLTVIHHPDKDTGSEAIYIQLKLARDILVDPTKRFAYDRFGPDVLAWQQTRTSLPDYIFAGLQQTTIHYAGLAIGLSIAYLLGYMKQGMFWRSLVMAGLFTAEAYMATRPYFPAVLTRVINPTLIATGIRAPYLPFQVASLLRNCAVTFFIALSQLSPLLRQGNGMNPPPDGAAGVPTQLLDRVDGLTQVMDQEITRLKAFDLAPFAGDAASATDLKDCVKKWLVQNTVINEPEVRSALVRAAERRRGERDGVDEIEAS